MTFNCRGFSAGDIVAGITNGDFSCQEVVEAYLQRLEENKDLNAFITVNADKALALAKKRDQERQQFNKADGVLFGVPIAVKDVLCTEDIKTTAASRMLSEYTPSYNATAVAALLSSGAIVIGKTNCDEFAMGSSNENSYFGPVLNPWDKTRVPGGSSGGSAVAVAADFAPVALGTDTGGSVRQPAGFCNLVGFKPSYGSISRYGLIAMASSLDQVGIFSHTVQDAELLYDVMIGPDGHDQTVVNHKQQQKKKSKEIVIGLPKEYLSLTADAETSALITQAIEIYKSLGCRFVDVSIPLAEMALAAYYVIMPAEVSSNLARLDGLRYGDHDLIGSDYFQAIKKVRSENFGVEVKRRILIGTYVLSSGYQEAFYGQATKLRQLLIQQYNQACQKVDLLLVPTAPLSAFKIGEKTNDPLAMYLADIFTVSVNMIGYAGINLPSGFNSDGLPVGQQLICPPGREKLMLALSLDYQQATNWHNRQAPC
jgi:aspartyl-tRNA(Asn)/glutamyl-tRNA(Gln) amidotransferase subunit A